MNYDYAIQSTITKEENQYRQIEALEHHNIAEFGQTTIVLRYTI
jgi:hypothetical protein